MRSLTLAFLAASTAASLSTASLPSCPLLHSPSTAEIIPYIRCADDSVIQACLTAAHAHDGFEILIPCLRVSGCEGTDELLALCDNHGPELRRKQVIDPNAAAAAASSAAASTAQTDTPTDTATPTDKNAKTTPTANTKATDIKATDTKTQVQTTVATDISSSALTTPTAAPSTTLETSASTPFLTSAESLTSSSSDLSTDSCLATSFISTSFCGIITAGGSRTTLPCVATVTPSTYCAPGMLCQTQAAGVTTCMRKQTKLTTSGLVVAIVFGTALASCFSALIFVICRNKRAQRQRERVMQAEAVRSMQSRPRGASDVDAMNLAARESMYSLKPVITGGAKGRRVVSSSEASIPLMAQQGPAGGLGTDTGYRAASGSSRTLHKQPPPHSRGVSPLEEGDDIGYRRG